MLELPGEGAAGGGQPHSWAPWAQPPREPPRTHALLGGADAGAGVTWAGVADLRGGGAGASVREEEGEEEDFVAPELSYLPGWGDGRMTGWAPAPAARAALGRS